MNDTIDSAFSSQVQHPQRDVSRSTLPHLRPYQEAAIDSVRGAIAKGKRRLLLVCPTGAGKTIMAGALAARAVRQGRRIVFLCHRRELVQQASRKLFEAGIEAGIIAA